MSKCTDDLNKTNKSFILDVHSTSLLSKQLN